MAGIEKTIEVTVHIGRVGSDVIASAEVDGEQLSYVEQSGGTTLAALVALAPRVAEHVDAVETVETQPAAPVLRLHRGSRRDGPPMVGGSEVAA